MIEGKGFSIKVHCSWERICNGGIFIFEQKLPGEENLASRRHGGHSIKSLLREHVYICGFGLHFKWKRLHVCRLHTIKQIYFLPYTGGA